MTQISACERVVLLELLNDWESEMVSSFRNLATMLNLAQPVVKRRVRRLAGKGLAERVATFTDDGYIAGSGYMLTQKGVIALFDESTWSYPEAVAEILDKVENGTLPANPTPMDRN